MRVCLPLTCVSRCSLRVNAVLEGGLRLSQLSALSLLEMSSSESLGVENGELLSTSSYLRLRLRDEPASMETPCLRAQSSTRQATDNTLCTRDAAVYKLYYRIVHTYSVIKKKYFKLTSSSRLSGHNV